MKKYFFKIWMPRNKLTHYFIIFFNSNQDLSSQNFLALPDVEGAQYRIDSPIVPAITPYRMCLVLVPINSAAAFLPLKQTTLGWNLKILLIKSFTSKSLLAISLSFPLICFTKSVNPKLYFNKSL